MVASLPSRWVFKYSSSIFVNLLITLPPVVGMYREPGTRKGCHYISPPPIKGDGAWHPQGVPLHFACSNQGGQSTISARRVAHSPAGTGLTGRRREPMGSNQSRSGVSGQMVMWRAPLGRLLRLHMRTSTPLCLVHWHEYRTRDRFLARKVPIRLEFQPLHVVATPPVGRLRLAWAILKS